jgi:hypothetical protein
MTTVLSNMAADGHAVTPGLVACTNPYICRHILRLSKYALDMSDLPPPLDPQPLPFEIAWWAHRHSYTLQASNPSHPVRA